eukprot:COSAG04_NODE_28_length_36566_cov_70.886665_4_plen_234_part_00
MRAHDGLLVQHALHAPLVAQVHLRIVDELLLQPVLIGLPRRHPPLLSARERSTLSAAPAAPSSSGEASSSGAELRAARSFSLARCARAACAAAVNNRNPLASCCAGVARRPAGVTGSAKRSLWLSSSALLLKPLHEKFFLRHKAQSDCQCLIVGGVALGRSVVQPLRVAASGLAPAVTRPGAGRIPSPAAYRPQSRRGSDTMGCVLSAPLQQALLRCGTIKPISLFQLQMAVT